MAQPGMFDIDIDDTNEGRGGFGHGIGNIGGQPNGCGAACDQDGEHAINLDIEIQVRKNTFVYIYKRAIIYQASTI